MLRLLDKLFRALSSFGFVCVVLLFLLLLTWLGTLEQIEFGLYQTQKKYFESLVLLHDAGPWQVSLPFVEGSKGFTIPSFPVPLPGVNLLLSLLMVNLFCGGIIRLRKDVARVGILITHLGMVLMLAAGFVKFRFSNDGMLMVGPHETGRYYYGYHDWDLSIRDANATGSVREWVIPGEEWRDLDERATRRFTNDALPFDLLVTKTFRNCSVVPKGPMFRGDGQVIDGYVVLARKEENENEQNVPAAYVTLVDKTDGKQHDAILWGLQKFPLTHEAGGKQWFVDLGKRRYELPFAIRLDNFRVEFHPATDTPRTFWSDVTKIEDGKEQAQKITMNEPLRHGDYVLFQSNWGPQERPLKGPFYSVFTVVRNPSDQWPKWSCCIIGAGLLLHFSMRLVKYVRAQRSARAREAA
jgi:hypothetical protein